MPSVLAEHTGTIPWSVPDSLFVDNTPIDAIYQLVEHMARGSPYLNTGTGCASDGNRHGYKVSVCFSLTFCIGYLG
jgi:hypothetical protein